MFSKYDPSFNIESREVFEYYIQYTVSRVSSRQGPVCKCIKLYGHRSSTQTIAVKNGFDYRPRIIHDLTDEGPARIIIKAMRKWKCTNCNTYFPDPAMAMYTGGKKTTADFDEHIAQCLVSDSYKTVRQIAADFNIDKQKVSEALHSYVKSCQKIMKTNVPCSRIWLLPVWYGKKRLVVFGEQKDTDKLVLLGVSAEFDIGRALDCTKHIEPMQTIFCPSDLRGNMEYEAMYDLHDLPPKYPDNEMARILRVIKRYWNRHIPFDLMLAMIPFQNKYQRDQVIQAGHGHSLSDHVQLWTPSNSTEQDQTIRYVDIDLILKDHIDFLM